MKTSNSVLCAVVVLWLSAVVSPPQAFAAIEKIHPATMCGRMPFGLDIAGAANITRKTHGIIENNSPTQILYVTCDIVNDANLAIGGFNPRIIQGSISMIDRHPTQEVYCALFQSLSVNGSSITFNFIQNFTTGDSNDVKFLNYGTPDPTLETGIASNNWFFCEIPPTFNGRTSQLISYSVIEE